MTAVDSVERWQLAALERGQLACDLDVSVLPLAELDAHLLMWLAERRDLLQMPLDERRRRRGGQVADWPVPLLGDGTRAGLLAGALLVSFDDLLCSGAFGQSHPANMLSIFPRETSPWSAGQDPTARDLTAMLFYWRDLHGNNANQPILKVVDLLTTPLLAETTTSRDWAAVGALAIRSRQADTLLVLTRLGQAASRSPVAASALRSEFQRGSGLWRFGAHVAQVSPPSDWAPIVRLLTRTLGRPPATTDPDTPTQIAMWVLHNIDGLVEDVDSADGFHIPRLLHRRATALLAA